MAREKVNRDIIVQDDVNRAVKTCWDKNRHKNNHMEDSSTPPTSMKSPIFSPLPPTKPKEKGSPIHPARQDKPQRPTHVVISLLRQPTAARCHQPDSASGGRRASRMEPEGTVGRLRPKRGGAGALRGGVSGVESLQQAVSKGSK